VAKAHATMDMFVDEKTGETLDPVRTRAVLRLSGPISRLCAQQYRLERRKKETAAQVKLNKERLGKAMALLDQVRFGEWQEVLVDEIAEIESDAEKSEEEE